jgi:hypothetical protein
MPRRSPGSGRNAGSQASGQLGDHIEASLRQGVRHIVLKVRELGFFALGRVGRVVGLGPGVAAPKSRCPGCKPAALASVSFPGCPPGPVSWAAAVAASAQPPVDAVADAPLEGAQGFFRVLPSAGFLSYPTFVKLVHTGLAI